MIGSPPLKSISAQSAKARWDARATEVLGTGTFFCGKLPILWNTESFQSRSGLTPGTDSDGGERMKDRS